MNRHQYVVLQESVRSRAVGWYRPHGNEWICRTRQEQREEPGDREHHHRCVRHQVARAAPMKPHDRCRVQSEHPRPEEDRTLQRAPQRNDREQQRGRPAAYRRHVRYREIVRDEREDHQRRRKADERKIGVDRAICELEPLPPAGPNGDRGDYGSEGDHCYGNEQRIVRDETRHGADCWISVLYFSCASSPGSGARYSFECFTIRLVASNTPPLP